MVQASDAFSAAEFVMTLLNPDSQRCLVLWDAQLQTLEENTFSRLSTFVMANGSGLGPIPGVRMRKEDAVSGFGGWTGTGGWDTQVCSAHPGFPGSAQQASLCDAKGLLFTLNICVF